MSSAVDLLRRHRGADRAGARIRPVGNPLRADVGTAVGAVAASSAGSARIVGDLGVRRLRASRRRSALGGCLRARGRHLGLPAPRRRARARCTGRHRWRPGSPVAARMTTRGAVARGVADAVTGPWPARASPAIRRTVRCESVPSGAAVCRRRATSGVRPRRRPGGPPSVRRGCGGFFAAHVVNWTPWPGRGRRSHGACRRELSDSRASNPRSVGSHLMSHVLAAVAWPYANGPRHIGHVSGFGVPSDVFSRYMRMAGHDVLMVSGTDEHGTPILVQAEKEGVDAARAGRPLQPHDRRGPARARAVLRPVHPDDDRATTTRSRRSCSRRVLRATAT